MNKKHILTSIAFSAMLVFGLNFKAKAATVGYGTALGSFLLADGRTALTTGDGGGISIGFFTGSALPTKAQLLAITSDPYNTLVSTYAYVDLRNVRDSANALATFQTGGTWDFSPGWTGGTLNVPVPPSNYPNAINANDALAAFTGGTTGTATTLWAFAFNAGNYANGFLGSTQMAAVTATEPGGTANDWTYPTSSENIQLSQINIAGEVLVGTDGASAGISGVGANDVLMVIIPEPTTGSLSLVALGLFALSRRTNRMK